jgi:hypothetical protein
LLDGRQRLGKPLTCLVVELNRISSRTMDSYLTFA